MIRILPSEFNLNKMKQLRDYVKQKLVQPHIVYQEEARINPKFQTKLIKLEDIVQID